MFTWIRNPSKLLAAVAALALVGCGAPSAHVGAGGSDSGVSTVVHIDKTHYLGTPVTVKNLTVWPIHTNEPLVVGEFMTLAEAQRGGLAEVRERGGAQNRVQAVASGNDVDIRDADAIVDVLTGQNGVSGRSSGSIDTSGNFNRRQQELGNQVAQVLGGGATVNTIEIENRGDLPILVCAGSLVRGGNQDRQIGEDIVIAAHSTVPVEAFCVEQGRWSNDRAGVQTTAAFEAVDLVAAKGVRMNGQYLKAQDGVWENVAGLNGKLADQQSYFAGTSTELTDVRTVVEGEYSVTDPGVTSFFANVEGLPKQVKEDRAFYVAAVESHFARLAEGDGDDAPVGFAYAVNGEVVTVRTFAHARLLRSHLGAFAQAMSVEAHLATADIDGDLSSFEPAGPYDVVNLVTELEAANDEEVQSAGANRNFVRKGDAGYASRCDLQPQGGKAAVTLTRDWTKK